MPIHCRHQILPGSVPIRKCRCGPSLVQAPLGEDRRPGHFKTEGIVNYFKDFKKVKPQIWAERSRFRIGNTPITRLIFHKQSC